MDDGMQDFSVQRHCMNGGGGMLGQDCSDVQHDYDAVAGGSEIGQDWCS